jgi:multidrug efflux system membrane fusion protein
VNKVSFAIAKFLHPRKPAARIAGAVLCGALLAGGLHHVLASDGQQASGARSAAAAVPVHTALVRREDLPLVLTGIGTARAAMSVTVRSRVDGQLDSVAFTEGQDVTAGALLASIDDRTYAAAVEQAEAQQARDAAALANAEADLKRYGELVGVQGATQQQVDTAQALVRQLQAASRGDAAQLDAARVQLQFTRISAPIAGRVGARLVDPGNIVHAADAGGLAVINQIDPIAVQFALPEGNFQAINAALGAGSARLVVQALERDTRTVLAEGHLVLLDNQIDVSTGTVELKAMFANPQHRLWPGQSVDARLVLGVLRGVLTVPPAAIQRGPTGLFTYVVDGEGKAAVRSITAGEADATRVQVTSGLAAGDRVVVDGQFRLVPGASVTEASDMPAGTTP